MLEALSELAATTGVANLSYKQVIMIAISCFFLYLAIKKQYDILTPKC
ncbi:hypothetical protein [Pisciglobus halotolerans]|uniref:Oxaloacetate decarboxylase, beta subunit n=1 Tax=Pisciglobus halotolerans TaxID=745365 RepID=A0A1I3E2X9_9LACT|nr:hypothetical protein [Pisciglobus halotolerans]SFH93347.1 oxaloacetate decarboxylase, beta subunit [Pisciglobus halotolerans]